MKRSESQTNYTLHIFKNNKNGHIAMVVRGVFLHSWKQNHKTKPTRYWGRASIPNFLPCPLPSTSGPRTAGLERSHSLPSRPSPPRLSWSPSVSSAHPGERESNVKDDVRRCASTGRHLISSYNQQKVNKILDGTERARKSVLLFIFKTHLVFHAQRLFLVVSLACFVAREEAVSRVVHCPIAIPKAI